VYTSSAKIPTALASSAMGEADDDDEAMVTDECCLCCVTTMMMDGETKILAGVSFLDGWSGSYDIYPASVIGVMNRLAQCDGPLSLEGAKHDGSNTKRKLQLLLFWSFAAQQALALLFFCAVLVVVREKDAVAPHGKNLRGRRERAIGVDGAKTKRWPWL